MTTDHIPVHFDKSLNDKAHLGARSELVACAWLMAQGYAVFRNVCPTGPVDIIAMSSSGRIIKIDVKTATAEEERHKRATYRLKRKQELAGISMITVFHNGHCELASSKPFKKKVSYFETPTLDKRSSAL